MNPIDALEKLNQIESSILVNENIFKNLNLKINDFVKVQDKEFNVIGIVKVLPDIGGAFVFGDFALTGKKTLDKLDLNTLGSFLNYEYKVKFNKSVNSKEGIKRVENLFKDQNRVRLRYPENSAEALDGLLIIFTIFITCINKRMLIAGIGIANTLLSFINQKIHQLQFKSNRCIFWKHKTIYYFN